MFHRSRFSVAVAGAVALAVGLAACGSDNSDSMSGHDMSVTTAVATGNATEHNSSDVMFAQMMIPHHQQAIEMSRLGSTRASSSDVKSLAAQIEAAQDPEIATMRGWLESWSEPVIGSQHSMHDMTGMMSDADMTTLSNAKGKDFDRLFLTMMTTHHQGAIQMAKTEQESGRYGLSKTMADNIVATQQAEIDHMNKLLAQL